MNEPHKVSEPTSAHEQFRRLQMAEGQLAELKKSYAALVEALEEATDIYECTAAPHEYNSCYRCEMNDRHKKLIVELKKANGI